MGRGKIMKQNPTVMVVDDNPLNLRLMEAMLATDKYNVVSYESGKTCLEAICKEAPDVILLDAMMPNMNGFQVVRMLKADAETRMIPVIMVTSLSDTKDKVEAIEAGADDFLSKPVTKVELLARIRSLIKTKMFNDQLVESERRYRELVQDANVIIFLMNGQGRITFMNEYGLSFFGYTDEEIVGKTEWETILPEYESTGRNLKKNAEEIKTNIDYYKRYAHENLTKNRRRVWVDWTNRCVVDRETGETGLMCVGIDITAAKWAEHEQRRQHERRKRREVLNDGIQRHLSEAELLGELNLMGTILAQPFLLCVLAIPAEYLPTVTSDPERMERQRHIDQLIDYLQDAEVGVVWETQAGIAVLQSLSGAKIKTVSVATAKTFAQELGKTISRHWVDLKIRIGVTHSPNDTADLAELFKQASAALHYGPVLESDKLVYHWRDLGCYQFIVKDLQTELVRQFVQEQLEPMLHAAGTADLLATMEALLSGDSFQVIADRLHVHKQTIVFRKKKIEDILHIDLDDPATRMNLSIAMKLLSVMD